VNRAELMPNHANKKASPPGPRADVQAMLALVALDEGIAKREASVAKALALAGRAEAEIAQMEPALRASRDRLRRREQSGAPADEIEKLRRTLQEEERHATQLLQLAEKKQAEAGAASADLRDACADLAARRGAITSQIRREALENYEAALRRGLMPAAVATRGRVCWGCFHGLSAAVAAEFHDSKAFLRCPHCERVLFNPDWSERP